MITDHRPWPMPSSRWIIAQQWHRLLFAHWPVAPAVLRPLIPDSLELDTFDGEAWLGVVPFEIRGFRPRGQPYSLAFPELNVRTYVTAQGKPGVWFFSLDAANWLAVFGARRFYHLPYFKADMSLQQQGDTVNYTTQRRAASAEFSGAYRPTGEVFRAQTGTLDHWLTERYCLYASHGGRLYRGEVHHKPWPLQPAEVEIRVNTMARVSGIPLPETAPLLHYAHRLDVMTWAIRRVS
jgi:uncharacterized protein